MNIKGKCKFDFESMKALSHMVAYRKRNPKKEVIGTYIFCVIMAAFVLTIAKSELLMLLIVAIAILNSILYFGLPHIQYRSLAKMKNIENEYTFYDDYVLVETKSEAFNGEAEVKYSLLIKVVESSKYFFLYQNKNQVYLIDKSTITNGTPEEIRDRLKSFVGKKYILCKY